ncbi:MAG: hypothetical protein C0503_07015 [Gemmatimonas sp.]|nr:hypothetical protein [Gemmatimonas sp.]
MRPFVLGLVGAALLLPGQAVAQRGEITVVGGIVQSPDEEFDRVIGSNAPVFYTRQRGERSSGAAFGAAASFAIRGHVFAEIGIMSHPVERAISTTGLGDESGPFLVTNRFDGRITSIWLGPSYRVIDRERFALSALAAPMVLVMTGDAFDRQQVFHNAPSRSAAIGFMVGARARLWMTERFGAQLGVEDAIWTFPLTPHANDGTPFAPGTSQDTPRQHDLRVSIGASYRLF